MNGSHLSSSAPAPAAWLPRLRQNLERLQSTVAEACRRAGRSPDDVHLVAVTKSASPEVISAVADLGLTDLGESRVQQLVTRATAVGSRLDPLFEAGVVADASGGRKPRWHMIGHLQRNKVRALLSWSRVLHSLDSPRLAEEIQSQADRLGATVDVFVETNVSGEASKGGVAPADLPPLVEKIGQMPNLRLHGLMTMAPLSDDPQAARPHFARLRELLDGLRASGAVPRGCVHLSMGMTLDYAVGVEEGATFIRVGSAIFDGID